jgi:ABC-type transport system involved in cytochrome c biogenesis permease subunit
MYKFLFLFLFFLFPCSEVSASEKFSVNEFTKIPVVHEGRIKPIDSFSRIYLTRFYHKDKFAELSASEWFAELIFDQKKAYERKVFKINNPDVLHAIGLRKEEGWVYSFNDIASALAKNLDVVQSISQANPEKLSLSQKQLKDLFQSVGFYYDLSSSFVVDKDESFLNMPSKLFKILPSPWKKDNGNWFSPDELLLKGSGSPLSSDYLQIWQTLKLAYLEKDQHIWNQAVLAAFSVSQNLSKDKIRQNALKAEVFYNEINVFKFSFLFYIASFLILIFSSSNKRKSFYKVGLGLLSIGAILHVFGLCLRVYIMQRPPIATLYESVLFVGLICVAFSLFLEKNNRDNLGVLMGSLLGATLHFIAMRFVLDGNTLQTLAAVLNTNFWLATHVVVITIGYGACLVTSMLSHMYLLIKVFHGQEKDKLTRLYKNIQALALISLLFCLLGTILGGIWADQSWGRFWGWDPKENGALLICLWLLSFFHGKISMVLNKTLFVMGMAFLLNIVALAWFGVNLLSVGLHSYGFTDNIALNLLIFISLELSFLVFIGIMLGKNKTGKING